MGSALQELLSAEEVAGLCGRSVEWVEANRFRLPCEFRPRDGRIRVRREDLPVWLEAAQPRVERRARAFPESDVVSDLEAKWNDPSHAWS
jgi:hypothetical protein